MGSVPWKLLLIEKALIYDGNKNVYCDSNGAKQVKIQKASKDTGRKVTKKPKQAWHDPGTKCKGCNFYITSSTILYQKLISVLLYSLPFFLSI